MYLLGKRADSLEVEDIKRLVENKVQESKSLDYKRDLKLTQDNDKKEFLFDITSMSNTDGGCFIFGIKESKDEKNQNTGTPETITGITFENYDKLVQQIEDIIRGNTEPSITNITLKHLIVDEKSILVIGISKSLGLPVMVTLNNTNKFYRRRNSGKYSVDVYELNQMFMQNQVLKESIEKFRQKRIENVRSLKVFPNLDTSTSFFIHVIPFSFQNEQMLDLTNANNLGLQNIMIPIYTNGCSPIYNLDGYASTSIGYGSSQIDSYDQLFRNGIYEVYTSNLFIQRKDAIGKIILGINDLDFIPNVLYKINDAFKVTKLYQIEPPFIISLSMCGIKDGVILNSFRNSKPFSVDEIFLPSIIIPTYETDIYTQLKPVFDIIWQSVSFIQSPVYAPKQ